MVEYRDPETGQKTFTIVDKVVKKRVTPLKQAILKKREIEKQARINRREERKRMKEELKQRKTDEKDPKSNLDDGYVTIEEGKESDEDEMDAQNASIKKSK